MSIAIAIYLGFKFNIFVIYKCSWSGYDKLLSAAIIYFAILFFVLSPFLLAIKGYKDKSYKERYWLLWRDYWKPPFCVALSWVLLYVVIRIIKYYKDNG